MAAYSSHKDDCSKTNQQNHCSFYTTYYPTQFVLSPLPVVNETEIEMCINVTWTMISFRFFMKTIKGKYVDSSIKR